MAAIKIDEHGQIFIPLELSQQIDLQNNDWLKVNVKANQIIMTPHRDPDEDSIQELINLKTLY